MSPSAMLATQSEGRCRQAPATQTAAASTASTGTPARHQSLPSAISATPATQNAHRCCKAPRLPRRMHLDVAKSHVPHKQPRRPRHQLGPKRATSLPTGISAPATQNARRCRQVPRLPRKVKVDVASPSATPATQSEGRCRQAPRLPHKQQRRQRPRDPRAPTEPAQFHKCHACCQACQSWV